MGISGFIPSTLRAFLKGMEERLKGDGNSFFHGSGSCYAFYRIIKMRRPLLVESFGCARWI